MRTAEPAWSGGSWRAKWRWVGAYWVVQAAVLHVVVCSLFARSIPTWHGFVDNVLDLGVMVLDLIFALILTAAQAVLLLPVRRPRLATHGPGLRFVHGAVGGLAITGSFWLALWPVFVLLESLGVGHSMDVLFRQPLGWAIPLGVWVIATVVLCASGRNGLPVQVSVGLCALAAATLTAGLVGAVWAIPRLVLDDTGLERVMYGTMCGVGLLAWAVATPVVWSFVRRRGAEDGLARVSSRLLMGTLVETACVIPLDVMIRRKDNCYCEEGTFWALSACWAVGLFACGPVIFLVPLSGRRKRWYAGRCDACGYDMSGCRGAERCPECGAGWKPAGAGASEGC